jgi:ankyrin repeat protein
MRQGFIPKAKIFATRALEGRKKLIPAQMHEIFETANLLANACQLNQDYDEASGIRTWIYQKEVGTRKISRTESLKSNPPMADVLHWCKERGFDVDSPNFRFEHPNADGKTPLHIAISDEKLEIVEVITNHVQTLETRDNDSATGLLLACSTRNRRTTEVLLRKGAKVGVQDMYLNTPLHRVQSAEKGIAVAQLLLKYPNRPIDINQKNIYDKTALHLACEMANEPMVDLLLDHGADPNCPGPAKCTPLHVSIYSRRISIVKKLLERGADTALRDSRGLDAITAANTTKLASQNIIKLVLDHEHRVEQDRLRRLSQTRSLETPSGERRKSSTASELTRLETSGSSGQSGGQIRKQSSPSSLPRKDTIYSQSSSGSGGSTGEKEPTSPSETSSSKSSMSLKLPFRRFKASND